MKTELITHEGVHVKKSTTHGWGVFTNLEIKEGDIVEECIVPYDIISLNSSSLLNYRFIWPNMSFKVANKLSLDIEFSGYCLPLGFGSIYNHSENPNVAWDVDISERVVQFVALRDIKADEELLFDYESPVIDI